jgi:uncharacterized repeat protein (TIGR01451 family)
VATVMLVAGLVAMPVAQAQTVYSVGCDVPGLISAITSANSSGGGTLDLATDCTYLLGSGPYSNGLGADGLPVITTAIRISGDGSTITRSSSATAFRLIELDGATSGLTAADLTLSNGDDAGGNGGGAIYNDGGSLTVSDSNVSDNTSTGDGGGIDDVSGTLSVADSALMDNTSSDDSGGAISNAGPGTVVNSSVSGNTAFSWGGGIFNTSGGTLTVAGTLMSNNTADSDEGGGVANNGGTLILTNDTLWNNLAASAGGAVSGSTAITLTSDTIADNSVADGPGGGIFTFGVVMASSIVADNSGAGNCGGATPTDEGYNLDTDGTCDLHASTDKNDVDPQLGSLQANGGPTLTMAPASTSPVVDAIPPGVNGCGTTITTDQRGALRPNGTGCDIGAYEYGDVALQSLIAAPSPVKRKHTLTYTATVSNAGAADATGVTVTDTLPAGEMFKSADVSQGSCSLSAPTVTCTLGQVAAATTPTVTIVIKVTAKKGKTLTDTATVSATTGDTIPGNDSKTTDVTVS